MVDDCSFGIGIDGGSICAVFGRGGRVICESEDNTCDIADGHDVVRTKRRPPPSGVAALCTLFIISERGLITVYLFTTITRQRFVCVVLAVALTEEKWFYCC